MSNLSKIEKLTGEAAALERRVELLGYILNQGACLLTVAVNAPTGVSSSVPNHGPLYSEYRSSSDEDWALSRQVAELLLHHKQRLLVAKKTELRAAGVRVG